ncbi:MAG: xanthine dehydrogenase family protein subunit M [Burkholderiales bacterium]|nr:xanthine dehydrogenase family protein subunit M [Burkholderiales bacterium]
MYAFNYLKAQSVADAKSKVAAATDGKLLAGGQTLIAAMKLRLAAPSDLIDLGGVAELRGVKAGNGELTIGAMTTHADVAGSADVKRRIPALADLAGQIGDRMVRHMGTLGGSIANNDPAADYPAGLVGLGAAVVTDRRTIDADAFFTGMYETALEPGEIITAVRFPVPQRAAYAKFANPASRYALVGVFVAQTSGGVRVAVTGAGPVVFRVSALEAALTKRFVPEAVEGIAIDANGLNADMHAGAEYRAHLITVMTRRAVEVANA